VVKRGRKLDRLDARGRHRLRIKAKKLRYAAEFFAGTFGRRRRRERLLKRLSALQDDLGAANDAAAAHRLAAETVQGQPAEAGFAAGLVVAAREAAAKTAVEAAARAFAEVEAVERFWR
jgi:CHAD domain-containing protein